jgi:hypothetical protein
MGRAFAKPVMGFAVKSDKRQLSPLYPSYDLFHGIAGLALEIRPSRCHGNEVLAPFTTLLRFSSARQKHLRSRLIG